MLKPLHKTTVFPDQLLLISDAKYLEKDDAFG